MSSSSPTGRIEINLREIAEVKRAWPDRAVIVSAMVESKPEAWREIVERIEDTGADGIELNYGCPHGMSERGMGGRCGPGAGVLRADYALGDGGGDDSGDHEAHA